MLGNCILRYPIALNGKLDKGVICEALLYFGQAHLMLDLGTLSAVVQGNFLDDVIEMLKAGHLTANFSPQTPVLYTQTTAGLREHLFTVIKIGGDQQRQHMRNPELLERQLGMLLEDKGKVRSYFRQLSNLISFKDFSDEGIGQLGLRDISDPFIAREVVRLSLRQKGIPDEAIVFSHLDVLPLKENRFAVSTDIDFEKLKRFLPESDRATFGQNELFPVVSDVRFDIRSAAERNAAFVGNERNQGITDLILRRSVGVSFEAGKAQREIYDFISVATPSVREVINSGERTPQEFVKLLEKAGAFRRWLTEQNPTADLVKEMLREKAEVDWLDTLPMKALRFGLFVGGGKIGDFWAPGTSIAAEAVDTFVVERLAKRWRPHYFVENNLRSFLEGKGE